MSYASLWITVQRLVGSLQEVSNCEPHYLALFKPTIGCTKGVHTT